MNAGEIIFAATRYQAEHITCDCGADCDECAPMKRAIRLAYMAGVGACSGLLIATDGSEVTTPHAIFAACKEAISEEDVPLREV